MYRLNRKNIDLQVYYKIVVSGNQVIKDVVIRNFLHDDCNVLYIEMKTTELMNRFSCLVIRDIYDYVDSHKNDI